VLLQLHGRGAQGYTLVLKCDLRKSEVQNLCLPSIRYEDVRGLDVPVNNSVGIGCIQRVCNLDSQIQNCFDLQWPAGDPVFQGQTLQQLHSDEGSPINLVNFVDRADVRVV
jgi:hypothetical protein